MTETPNQIVQFEAGANPVPTGLVTAPVTQPVALPDGWTVQKAIELIDACARNLYDEAFILKQFTLTKPEFDALLANEWFKKAVAQATLDWNSATNVQKRLAIETALALEKNLPALAARLGRQTEPLPGVVALAKLFAEIAGSVGVTKPVQDTPREQFKIVFNLGADVQQFDKTKPLVQIQSPEGGSGVSLQSFLEAPGVPAPVQGSGEGAGN